MYLYFFFTICRILWRIEKYGRFFSCDKTVIGHTHGMRIVFFYFIFFQVAVRPPTYIYFTLCCCLSWEAPEIDYEAFIFFRVNEAYIKTMNYLKAFNDTQENYKFTD